jgi:hypothetical protein
VNPFGNPASSYAITRCVLPFVHSGISNTTSADPSPVKCRLATGLHPSSFLTCKTKCGRSVVAVAFSFPSSSTAFKTTPTDSLPRATVAAFVAPVTRTGPSTLGNGIADCPTTPGLIPDGRATGVAPRTTPGKPAQAKTGSKQTDKAQTPAKRKRTLNIEEWIKNKEFIV